MRFRRAGMREYAGARGRDHLGIAGSVIQVFVGIEDLRDREPVFARCLEALVRIEGIHDQRLAGLRAGDEIVENFADRLRPRFFRPACGFPSRRRLAASGPERLVEQSMLRFQRYANAHCRALADHRVNVDVATHELETLADTEQAESTARGWAAG